jgi:hypothetical protein
MREPISRDSASPRDLAEAINRLDGALGRLDAACAAKLSTSTGAPDQTAYAALESDCARLAAELDAAHLRERDLAAAGAAASRALGRAATEVRSALVDGEGGDGEGSDEEKGEAETMSKPNGRGLNEEAA